MTRGPRHVRLAEEAIGRSHRRGLPLADARLWITAALCHALLALTGAVISLILAMAGNVAVAEDWREAFTPGAGDRVDEPPAEPLVFCDQEHPDYRDVLCQRPVGHLMGLPDTWTSHKSKATDGHVFTWWDDDHVPPAAMVPLFDPSEVTSMTRPTPMACRGCGTGTMAPDFLCPACAVTLFTPAPPPAPRAKRDRVTGPVRIGPRPYVLTGPGDWP